ncbi:MAG: hypothetical protein ABJB34_07275, partial [Acidobacteriota bacterium]
WRFGGPKWLRVAIWTLGFLGSPKMRPFFRLARKRHDHVPRDASKTKFVIPDLEEISRAIPQETAS